MVVIGILAGFGHGIIQPIFILVLGGIIDTYSLNDDPGILIPETNIFVLDLVYLGIAALICAYIRDTMFFIVGQSQTNKIRKEYVKAILRQEIGWYDGRLSGELADHLSK